MSVTTDAASTPHFQVTPLHALHMKLGARMVPFAGYQMPVQYPPGILKEHLHTRDSAGLFDVSHMGQIGLRPKSGKVEDVATALEALVPTDICGLPQGRQRYTVFTNERGGILDDLMVINRGDALLLIVNAACKVADEAHLRAHLSEACEIEVLDRGLIALQGPRAEAALASLAPGCRDMTFMEVRELPIASASCIVSRSGYTGEDGFEISIPAGKTIEVAEALLGHASVMPIGLGARDSLRLEAGLPLYGADLDLATTPVQAELTWTISKSRRAGGARASGFPGADVILKELATGAEKLRVGLRPEGRQPIRAGATLFADESGGSEIGAVTSGGFGPSASAPVAMAYVRSQLAANGTRLWADVRGKRTAVTVAPLPFVAHRYKRG